MRKCLCGIVACFLMATSALSPRAASATSPAADEMAEAQEWAAAKFEEGTLDLRQAGRSPSNAEPFFSFTYNGRPSAEVLKTWTVQRTSRLLDEKRTQHTLAYRDPKTGVVLRCVGIQYGDFPTVEWTLYFRNAGDKETPILADICPLDIAGATEMTGRELLETGLPISIPNRPGAVIMTYAKKEVAKNLSQNRRGLAHFAESSEQNVPVPLSSRFGDGL